MTRQSGFPSPGRYNRRMRRLLLLLAACAIASAQKRPFDVNALMELKRIGDPQISPDGKLVAFTVQTVDVAANKKPQQVWIVPLEGGGQPRQLTHDGDANQRPRWSPDSKRIAYISDRGGSSQIWVMDPDGANPRQVTNLPPKPTALFSPDGKNLVFTSESIPNAAPTTPATRRTSTPKRPARSTPASTPTCSTATGPPGRPSAAATCWSSPPTAATVRDLTPGNRDVPPFSLGGPDDYAISPDGQEVCFAMNADPVPATSTNSDLYVVSMAGGPARKITITPGADASPLYSPDGKYIAWRAPAPRRLRKRPLAPHGARAHHRQDHQSHRDPRPLGQQLHLVPRFHQPLLHHRRSRPPEPSR